MGSAPSPPTPEDPNVVASQQQGYNTQSGEMSQQGSMVNQYNPYGSLSYTQTGTSPSGTPLYSASESLSQPQQNLLTTQELGQQEAGIGADASLAQANYGAVPAAQAIGNETSGLTGQAVSQEEQYLQPFFQPQVAQLDTQLRNQGFDPSSPAYQQAMNNLLQSQGQTETGFVANIEPQMFQQAESTYELPAQLAESLGGYGAPANLNNNLTSTPALTVQPANLEGAVSTAEQQQEQTYQDQMQQYSAMMSGLFGIPTAVLGGLGQGIGKAAAPALLAAL